MKLLFQYSDNPEKKIKLEKYSTGTAAETVNAIVFLTTLW